MGINKKEDAAPNDTTTVGKRIEIANSDWCSAHVNGDRCRIDLCIDGGDERCGGSGGVKCFSSAILNGGIYEFDGTTASNSNDDKTRNDGASSAKHVHIVNAKVPSGYNGYDPDPRGLLVEMARSEPGLCEDFPPEDSLVGLLTAASMKTLRHSRKTATALLYGEPDDDGTVPPPVKREVKIDVFVTAGISNSRVAGADADWFLFSNSQTKRSSNSEKNAKQMPTTSSKTSSSSSASPSPPGTINTIVLTNVSYGDNHDNERALVEGHAIIVEAKCRACNDLGVVCQKNPQMSAQGTGTDSVVLVAQQPSPRKGRTGSNTVQGNVSIQYAGKHTLFAELLGQAVYEATRQSILCSIEHEFGTLFRYRLAVAWKRCRQALQHGNVPMIPLQPGDSLSKPTFDCLSMGIGGILACFLLSLTSARGDNDQMTAAFQQPDTVVYRWSVLMAVVVWDRYFVGLIPYVIHPVVFAGRIIRRFKRWTPETAFGTENPLQGLIWGLLLWIVTMTVSLGTATGLLHFAHFLGGQIVVSHSSAETLPSSPVRSMVLRGVAKFIPWFTTVFVVQGGLALHLLCAVGLQMAKYLERKQTDLSRKQLSWLCSRDATTLQPDDLAAGTLESLSENLSDSFVGPLFYYILFGPLGSYGFRVANTLDSCVGFRGKYEWYGKPSARIDDVFCIIPARLTALFLAMAGAFVAPPSERFSSFCSSLQVAWRDAFNCESPNAGWPMATMAGLLNLRLEKKGHYALGKGRVPSEKDIRQGSSIVRYAAMFAILFTMVMVGLRGTMLNNG